MTGRHKKRIIILAAVLILMIPYCSLSEGLSADILLTGKCNSPVTVTVSSPAYSVIAQYGEERTKALNKLLRHLSISVTLDEDTSETSINVDNEPVYSYIQKTKKSVTRTVYSVQPDTVYEQKNEETDTGNLLTDFLNEDFFRLNRMLDDLYPAFENAADAFKEYSKPSNDVNLNFRGYGKGVRRLTIPLSEQYVKKHFPKAAARLVKNEDCAAIIRSLAFSGPQKIILLYNQDNRVLRINYDGTIGFSEDTARRVSAVWRCVRSGKIKKDHITLKTPAVKGSDKYNLTYEREEDRSDSDRSIIKWNLQLDIKEGEVRKKSVFNADLQLEQKILKGTIQYSEKQDGSETGISIIPEMKKENGTEYSGTIEIANKSGKIVTNSTLYTVRISTGRKLDFPESAVKSAPASTEDTLSGEKKLQQILDSVLVRKLLTLPAEDTEFFSLDIPADIWNTLTQSLF